MQPSRAWYAPVLDLACLAAFVLVGGQRHTDLQPGVTWFFEVIWPIALGWFVVALLTKLYTRDDRSWLMLLVTLVGGIAIAQVLRGALQERPWIGIFTVVALGFIGLTTFGWRLIAGAISRRRSVAA